jgi:hypothetical protein
MSYSVLQIEASEPWEQNRGMCQYLMQLRNYVVCLCKLFRKYTLKRRKVKIIIKLKLIQ